MGLIFEWDTGKAKANFLKHGVSLEESATVFSDPDSLTIDDPLHSQLEKRNITLGLSLNHRLLVVVHTERGGKIRIISARPASRKERKQYEKED